MKSSTALLCAPDVDTMRRGIVLAMGTAVMSACTSAPTTGVAAKCTKPDWLYAGTDGRGLRAFAFDPCRGSLRTVGVVADVVKPRWAVAHGQLPVLYVAIDGNGAEGEMVAYAVELHTGALARINSVGAGGSGTTHLLLDERAGTLLAANFGGGSVASASVRNNGGLGDRVSTVRGSGSGPHRRQASAHAHGVSFDPSGRYVLVADLGADRISIYDYRALTHELLSSVASATRSFTTPAGSGPRRAVFGATGRYVYVLCELTAEILTLGWDPARGLLTQVQTLSISRAEFGGVRSASELALSVDGRFVYAADRGESMVLVYRADSDSGALSFVQRISCGGEVPWTFTFHPSGLWLLVANHRSDRIQVFRVDPISGTLEQTEHFAESPGPISLTFRVR